MHILIFKFGAKIVQIFNMERKNLKNFDQIKVRLLQFAESQKIPKTKFFEQNQLAASNFSGKGAESALSTDKIVQILTCYPELNSEWLLLGRGEMLRSATQSVGNISHSTAVGVNVNGNDINISYDPLLLPTVESLSDSVARLTAQNAQLLGELSRLISIVEKKAL